MVSSTTNRIECSICYDVVQTEESASTLNCSHKFHESCINRWIEVKRGEHREPTCPLDRSRITAINGMPLADPEPPPRGDESVAMFNEIFINAINIRDMSGLYNQEREVIQFIGAYLIRPSYPQ